MSIKRSISEASSRFLSISPFRSSPAISRNPSPAATARTDITTSDSHPSDSQPGAITDRARPTIGMVEITLDVVTEVAEATNNIPYLKAAAGIILQIIKIKDEVNQYRDRWQEVMENITNVMRIIYETHNLTKAYSNIPLTDDLCDTLCSMEMELNTVLDVMNQCKTPTKKWGKFMAMLERKDLLREIDKCDRKLKDCLNAWNARSNVIIQHQLHVLNIGLQAQSNFGRDKWEPELVSPQIFFGRDQEVATIFDMIFGHSTAHIAIMGPGGIGKTTLAKAILTHHRIIENFPRSYYFVSCEASTTIGALLNDMAQALGIINQSDNLGHRIMLHLEIAPCILCLDNFETPWDHDTKAAEEFLIQVASKKHVTLLITMRGEERPAGVAWSLPFLPSLCPLEVDSAKQTWQMIAGKFDQYAEKLIEAVGYHPLAITLLGRLAQSQTSESLWKRWKTDNIRLIGGKQGNKLTSLEVSMQLTLKSPRIQSDLSATRLLIILSTLPDGIHHSLIHKLYELFPDINTSNSIKLLLQSGLAYQSRNGTYQIEGLVRNFCKLYYPLSDKEQKVLQEYYIALAASGYEAMSNEHYNIMKIELKNVEAMLQQCLNISGYSDIKQKAIGATQSFIHFAFILESFWNP